jgi:hypothetical protein
MPISKKPTTDFPTVPPSMLPTVRPSRLPTVTPSLKPTGVPSKAPTSVATIVTFTINHVSIIYNFVKFRENNDAI